ncbi:MAG: ABC transporter substrate-binding protein [Planctomycetota bacterium]|nr:ABC transporter substrate-binding protein [Planctomycetota bacterium]
MILAVEESDNSLGFYDSAEGTEVGRVKLSLWPHEVAISPDGKVAYVSNFGLRDYDLTIGHAGNSVSAIHVESRCESDRYFTCSDSFRYWGPHGVKVTPDGASLYVNVERVVGLREPDPSAGPGMEVTKMLVFDLATKSLKRSFNFASEPQLTVAEKSLRFADDPSLEFGVPRGSHNFVFSADGKDLWIFSGRGGISKMEAATGKILAQLTDFNGSCRGLAFTKSGQLLVSATNEIALVDPKAAKIIKKIGNLGAGQILYAKATPDEKHALAPAVWEGQILVVDLKTDKVVKRISTGVDPVQVEIAPHEKSAFVTHGRSYWLSEIDLSSFEERRRIKTRGGPNGLAFAPWSPAPARGTITFGACLPFSGEFSAEGREIRLGLQHWQDKTNAAGGILIADKPHTIDIVYADTKSRSDEGELSKLADEFITSNKVQFLCSSYGPIANLAVAKAANKHKVPYITSTATDASLFDQGYEYVFGIMSNPSNGALSGTIAALRRFLSPNPRTVAMLSSDDPYSLADAKATAAYAESVGMQLLHSEGPKFKIEKPGIVVYPSGQRDFADIAKAIQEVDPDVLLHSGSRLEATGFIAACKAADFAPGCLAFNFGLTIPLFRNQLGDLANNIIGSVQWSDAVENCSNDRFVAGHDFARVYYEEFSEMPSALAAGAAACAVVYEEAIRKAKSANPAQVRLALTNIDLPTFYGRVRFNDKRLNTAKPMVTVQLRKKGISIVEVPIWPPDVADKSRPVWPFPGWSIQT